MRIHTNLSDSQLQKILQRPALENAYTEVVKEVFQSVKAKGDKAVLHYAQQWDKFKGKNFQVSASEIQSANKNLSPELQKAIKTAFKNISLFHKKQIVPDFEIETTKGIVCGRKTVAISPIGLYIPGGSAPLFSTVLMLGVPALIAQCKKVILCSPPDHTGNINPAVLFAAKLCGIKHIFKLGGSQAIAAMHYGTKNIPKVSKIFGPGNAIVTEAKRLAQAEHTAIDMLAGPTEVMIIADEKANVHFIASDVLAQLEHGMDSQAICLTNSKKVAENILKEVKHILPNLHRQAILKKSLNHLHCIITESPEKMITIANQYAPEHLIIHTKNPTMFLKHIENAGSIFLGNYTPEAIGDYASGTNHTLPTLGIAKSQAGVSLDSFIKKITWQKASPKGIKNIAQTVVTMAKAEGLDAHAYSVKTRLKKK